MPTLDLAPVGNCAVASLIDRSGRHLWFCYPRLDGDPMFNALVNGETPETGFMDVVLRDVVASEQRYLTNTAIVETTLTDAHGGAIRIRDFAPRFRQYGRNFRPPMLVRRIERIAGRPRIAIRVRPTFVYGSRQVRASLGSNHLRWVGESLSIRLTTDAPVNYVMGESEFALEGRVNLFFGVDEPLSDNPDTLAQSFLDQTTLYWQDWARGLNVPFDWQEAVIRAAITLKLCSYEDTGAIVAALTTSIPEAQGTVRNWDYRFCWLRDAYFTVNALNRLNATRTMEGFVRFVVDAAERDMEDGFIAPLFAIAPGSDVTERVAESLAGYRGNAPVRIGNGAVTQMQNDGYGSIVMAAAQLFYDKRLARQADDHLYKLLCAVGRRAERDAFTPDAGLWEYRGRARAFSYTGAMSWAALHRLGMIARLVGRPAEAQEWFARAGIIRQELMRRAVVPGEGWISGSLDMAVADASSLVLPELGVVKPEDPAFLKTLEVVERRLMKNGFLLRYDEADDFGTPDNAFLLCTFWYIDALALVGRKDEARELFANVLVRRNHVGLLAEDIDPHTGELWGNFPQTYSQVGLVLSAMRLSRSWEEGLWRAS
ncbi:MAG: glycoside hydrolase family 15 protein [Alphaproteobacteria bacterium]|nr:glycoside hydrolase family 15 protein [Alphaproteobacteria bacterium]